MLLRDKTQSRPAPPTLTEFEKRHEDRFKGVQFDWMEFQRDGAAFPVPNPNLQPAQQIVLQPAASANGVAAPAPNAAPLRPTAGHPAEIPPAP